MSLAEFSVKRPVATMMFYLIVILLGAVAFTRLPIDLLPEITFPSVTVSTSYQNVGPQEMEDLITRPIEETLAAIAGVEEISSSSSEGRSSVRVSFDWGVDLDEATDEVRTRIDRIRGRLPDDVEPPTIFKFDMSSMPIISLAISSDVMDDVELRDYVENQIEYRIERVPGVAAVELRGGNRRQFQVNLDRDKLLAYGLSADQITRLLRQENLNRPAGRVEEGNLHLYLRTLGEFMTPEDIGATVVTIRNGAPIYLRDIAEVQESVEEITQLVRINGVPGMFLSVSKQSGSNTVAVAEGVLEEIERINADMPAVKLIPTMDTSEYIKQSISNVQSSAMLGGLLAIVILLLFLRSGRSTMIIATTIPISVIASFALIYFTGFTLNIMTFGGLALGVGMLVDNAVVVLENIYRKRDEGQTARLSAVIGTKEVASAITASTITTLAVFLPVVFLEGVSGVMYKQLAVVVAFSLLASLAAALTLIPMLSSRLLERERREIHNRNGLLARMSNWSKNALELTENKYKVLIGWALKHRQQVVLGALIAFGLSLLLLPVIGSELMPATDEGEVRVNVEMAVGTRIELLDEAFHEVERVVQAEVPEMRTMISNMGGGGWRAAGGHTGNLRISLVPMAERSRSSADIANDLRAKLAHIPGARITAREGSGVFVMRMAFGGGDAGFDIEVRGHDLQKAYQLAEMVEQSLNTIPGVEDVRITRDKGRPERIISIDREKIARLGLSMTQVADIIENNVAGSRSTFLRRGGREYDIVVRLDEPYRELLTDIADISLVSVTGEAVPLRSVIEVNYAEGPVVIDRKDQERLIAVSANIAGRDLGSVIEDVRTSLRTIDVPEDFSLIVSGEYEEQQKAQRELMIAIILAILLVYMVMAAQFEDLLDPLIVMFSIPLAAIGVLLIMWLTGTTFNIQSFIGIIMLTGIVVNNAIVLVDYINLMRREYGVELHEAVMESGRRRLRPILMTTLTTLLGLVPLAMALSEGSEVQAAMARVVIGGLAVSTMITLIFIPVVYTTVAEWQIKRKVRRDVAVGSDGEGEMIPVPAAIVQKLD